ncbi:MAG: hypothetical protein LCH81_03620 [Bacteroidetes bacterium]|nr:hypothetical protein [Bacteroidota bacterium]
MNNETEPQTPQTPQTHLADHIYSMHTAITKLCMERWFQLAKDELEPEKIEQVKALLQEVEDRLMYAKSCCYWIENEKDLPIQNVIVHAKFVNTNYVVENPLLLGKWKDDEQDETTIN